MVQIILIEEAWNELRGTLNTMTPKQLIEDDYEIAFGEDLLNRT